MHPGRDGRIHINLEVPNRFEVASKRMQPARLLRGAEVFHRMRKRKKKKLQRQKSASFFWMIFFSPNLLSGADSDELQKKKNILRAKIRENQNFYRSGIILQ